MADEVPDALKQITPYVRRASEVEKTGDERAFVVAYFCRTYAMELGLKISSKAGRSAEVQEYLLSLMGLLEETKQDFPDLKDTDHCSEVVRRYAVEKMTEAEEEYMGGVANKNTARRFYAAASFFEVLATFNEDKVLDEPTKKQSLFAKWRATEILKAIKEGRPPVPTEAELEQARGDDSADDDDLLPPPAPSSTPGSSSRQAPPYRKPDEEEEEEEEEVYRPPPKQPSPSRKSSSRSSSRQTSSKKSSGYSEDQKSDALEYAKFAVRAIELDDVDMAIKHLESALRELGA